MSFTNLFRTAGMKMMLERANFMRIDYHNIEDKILLTPAIDTFRENCQRDHRLITEQT